MQSFHLITNDWCSLIMFVEFCVLVIENEGLNVLLVFEYAVLVGVIMTMMLPLESIVRDNLM